MTAFTRARFLLRGRTEVGVFRPSTGTWFLDANGKGLWDPGSDGIVPWEDASDVPPVVGPQTTGTTGTSGSLAFLAVAGPLHLLAAETSQEAPDLIVSVTVSMATAPPAVRRVAATPDPPSPVADSTTIARPFAAECEIIPRQSSLIDWAHRSDSEMLHGRVDDSDTVLDDRLTRLLDFAVATPHNDNGDGLTHGQGNSSSDQTAAAPARSPGAR